MIRGKLIKRKEHEKRKKNAKKKKIFSRCRDGNTEGTSNIYMNDDAYIFNMNLQ